MFPDEQGSYVGKTVYINGGDPVKIVGILDKLQAPWNGWDSVENSMLVPNRRDGEFQRYVIRVEPGMLNEMIPKLEEAMAANKDRLIESVRTMAEVRERSYTGDAGMVTMLTFIVTLLTMQLPGLGIVGLASFSASVVARGRSVCVAPWVQPSRKSCAIS